MDSTVDESDALDAAAAQAKRVLRENQARADKLKNVLCILQGKQDAAKRTLEDVVTRHADAVTTWKAAFRQVIDAQFVHKAKLLHDQMAVVRRASVGLHTSLERLEALRMSPAAGLAVPAITDVLDKYIAESREVQPDQLLDFVFREVPPDRWARSRLAVGYLQTSSLAPTDLTLEEVAADGLAVTLRAKSERPYDTATVTHLSYSVLDEEGTEITEVVWVDGHDGCFTVTFRAMAPGPHVVSVYLYSVHVNGSPLRLLVERSGGRAALKDASSQTSDPLAEIGGEGDEDRDFVGWMRARLEREISLPSPQAIMTVEGGAVARPVCSPRAGSGRLRLPVYTDIDTNNNAEPLADWNTHLFDSSGGGSSKTKDPQKETSKELSKDDTATRIRATLMRSLESSGISSGAGDGPTQTTKRETVRKPAAPLSRSTVSIPSSAPTSTAACAPVSDSARAPSAVPPKTSGSSASSLAGSAAGSTQSLAAEFGRMTIPGEPVNCLRRHTSGASDTTTPSPPDIQITVKQTSSRVGSPERVVRETEVRRAVEEFRRAVESSPKRETARVVTYEEPGSQWGQDDDEIVHSSPKKSQKSSGKSKQNTATTGPNSKPSIETSGRETSKPSQARVTAPRPLRTVRVTSDDLVAAAGPDDLAQGPVTAKLDLLLRPTPLFKRPIGVAATGDTLFIADTGNDTVRAFSADGTEMEPPVAELRRPSALAVLSGDRLAVRYDQGVRVYALFRGEPGRMLYQLGSGLLKRPFGLAVTGTERLVTVDGTRGRPVVHVFDASPSGEGRQVHSVEIAQHVRQPETAKLYFVAASETRVAVTDLGNNVVLLLNWEGRLVARVGEGVGPEARLYDPAGLALDSSGNLLVADSKHHRVVVYASDGTPRGAVGVSNKLNRPSGICLQGGKLYVLNYWDNTAHRYQLTVQKL